MKDIGIVGVPYSGKTTLFTAITRAGAAGGRSNQAVVDVPDERVGVLARLEGSARVVHAKVRFVDPPGGLTAQGLAEYRGADALCIVVGAFSGGDPPAELAEVTAELIVADLASIESGMDTTAKKARTSRDAAGELALLQRAHDLLSAERLLRDGDFADDEIKALKGYGGLTLKPWIVVANVAEGADMPAGLPEGALAISASLEAEVAGLPGGDAAELLAGYGIDSPGLNRVIASCYRTLDLITFLTATTDETRAWEVRRGATAPEAAGVIHSDFERGFIRVEVIPYDDVVSAGGWNAAKAQGLMRVEGKDYVVTEGDVLHVRFAV